MEQTGQILVVDDDQALLAVTVRVLRTAGYGVRTATTLAEAEERVAEKHPELILLERRSSSGTNAS